MPEAVAQMKKGLGLLDSMAPSPERQQQELDLRIALGPALIATTGYSSAEVGENLARASSLAEQLGRFDYVVPLLYGQFGYHLVRSEHTLALSFAERLQQIAHAAMLWHCCWVAFRRQLFTIFAASSLPPMRCSNGAKTCTNPWFGKQSVR
jgi:hypothetical protein